MDFKKAFFWYKKAAKHEHNNGQYNLGLCYENGLGITIDLKKAIDWYIKSADQGNANAQYKLGLYYAKGNVVTKDLQEAAIWFIKAADQGLVSAQYNLGFCYKNGLGVEKDLERAVFWYTQSANQENANAQYSLGFCYKYGLGVTKDLKEAVFWYTKAANQGYYEAQYKLGWCYAKGTGIKKDLEKAVFWYTQSAIQGYAEAQSTLGWCYETAKGIEKDLKKACFWYTKAAMQGHNGARSVLLKRYEIDLNKKQKKTKGWDRTKQYSKEEMYETPYEETEKFDSMTEYKESTVLQEKFGFDIKECCLSDDENKENLLLELSNCQEKMPVFIGLSLVMIPDDDHCLYRAVTLYLKYEDISVLRKIIAIKLEHNIDKYLPFISLTKGRTIEDYIKDIRNINEWAEDLEITVLSKLLDRPIVTIGYNGKITNRQVLEQNNGEPIFVYYDSINHYNALVLCEGYTNKEVLDKLLIDEKIAAASSPAFLIHQFKTISSQEYGNMDVEEKKDELLLMAANKLCL